MTGSLQIKNDKYYVVLNTYNELGQRKRKWISTELEVKGNKKKAQKFLRDILAKYDDLNIEQNDVYFNQWVKDWLELKRTTVDIVTFEGYETYFEKHINPYFELKKFKLIDISPKDIQDYINLKYKKGRLDGKGGLSAHSIKKHMVLIKGSLDHALRLNMIQYNPATRVTLPKETKFVGKYYTEKQAEQLFECVKETNIFLPVMLTVYYGLRRSEVLGLKWSSINFEENYFIIENTIVKTPKSIRKKEITKNKTSHRTLPLTEDIKKILKNEQRQQKENRLLYGNKYVINDYVCKHKDGRSLRPDFLTHKFSKILSDNNLPHIRFHDLRHSCASMLLKRKVSFKEIQTWLGHHDLATTSDIYGHLDFDSKISIASKMNECINMLKLKKKCGNIIKVVEKVVEKSKNH